MKHLEDNLQEACITWFRYQYPYLSKILFHAPNGGKRSLKEAMILKKQGVVPGVADLILLKSNANHNSLCIEMKSKEGIQTDNQKAWQKDCEVHNNAYFVCKSLDNFIEIINDYLNDKI